MEIVLLGNMGRDEATIDRLQDHTVHVLGQWRNPGLEEKSEASGGQYHVIDSVTDAKGIADIVQQIEPDMFLTNFDDSLAAGIVDVIKQRVKDRRMNDLLIPCPGREASRVEWDKFYLRDMIEEIDPKYNPINFMVITPKDVIEAISYFEDEGLDVALKPRNLTGGKGVKVMGKHFYNFGEARDYSLQVLLAKDQTGVEIQEKLEGHEFTLQLFTDGATLILPPATYDYPYREDGDSGPGTGGMGSFSMKPDETLPFINEEDYSEAVELMDKVLLKLKDRDLDYKGVLYPTFFKTSAGLKIVEINARGGDPELINILDLMEDNVDFGEVLRQIALGELTQESVRYKKLASSMIYLVSPDYGYRDGHPHDFTINRETMESHQCLVRFAAAERVNDGLYRSVGSSRTVGLSALGDTPWEARQKIHQAIATGFGQPLSLDYRQQIAEETYIKNLV